MRLMLWPFCAKLGTRNVPDMRAWGLLLLLLLLLLRSAATAPDVSDNEAESYSLGAVRGGCDCMEYWNCVMSGGTPYSYCGLADSNVCCLVPEGAKPVSSLVPSPSKPRCGQKGADSGRAGVAEPAEWPWHAAILEKPDDLYVCGASLLDESWVLTAAHCIEEFVQRGAVSRLKVRLGEFDVTDGGEPLRHEEHEVAGAALYPGFDNRSLAHDIALLRLRAPARRRPHIDVVCVPRLRAAHPPPGAACVITGWGRRTEDSDHSVVLKEISVPLWKNTDCERMLRRHFGPRYSLPDTAICAGAEGRDACDGDGGGPLVCEQNGRWYQVGVISFGVGCGRRNTPGVYTRVAMYEQWIMDTVLRHRHSGRQ
ncbi:tryptase beta-2-like [Schistocerca cancellata]|uniref:tryptase beta-2-like n=1 Tax=Schistocerca cancellata TaxID=274614 RepID=UPI00211791CA|nr:tryptase beta-2-like [Schistocerca cancellata]